MNYDYDLLVQEKRELTRELTEIYGIYPESIITNIMHYNVMENTPKKYVSIYCKDLDIGFSCGTEKSEIGNCINCYKMFFEYI